MLCVRLIEHYQKAPWKRRVLLRFVRRLLEENSAISVIVRQLLGRQDGVDHSMSGLCCRVSHERQAVSGQRRKGLILKWECRHPKKPTWYRDPWCSKCFTTKGSAVVLLCTHLLFLYDATFSLDYLWLWKLEIVLRHWVSFNCTLFIHCHEYRVVCDAEHSEHILRCKQV